MIRKHYLFFTMLAVCLGQLTVSTHAIAQDAVGRVIIVSGKLTAVKADGTQKKLRRKSKIFPGDTLQTGDKSKAQIRFIDGAIVSLTSSSELLVSEYAYDIDAPENNKSIMTLVTGGIRTITGAIGKEDQTDYKLNTPVATIGIRGTIYEVQQTETLAVAVWQGAITVSNDGGDIELGSGGDFNYARVESAYAAPKGLLSLPKEIAKKNDVPVEVEEDAKESLRLGEPGRWEGGGEGLTLPLELVWRFWRLGGFETMSASTRL